MRKGFTLIELLIVVGVTALIMSSIVGIMVQSFKAKTKLAWNEEIESNGTWILNEIRESLLEAAGDSISCSSTGDTEFSMVNIRGNGETTLFECSESGDSYIASNSANLLKDTLRVSNCNNFVSCDTLPLGGSDYRVTKVNLSFDLSPEALSTESPDYIRRTFQTSVVIRN